MPRKHFNSPGRIPRFFLNGPIDPGAGGPIPLCEDDVHHALHVQRLQPGDPVWGMDGLGKAYPLRVQALERRQLLLELDPDRSVQEQPRPGTETSPLPSVELAVSLPKTNRMEDMLLRLTQLGVARLQPIVCAYTPPGAREEHKKRISKWERCVREAMKQSGRLWPLEIASPMPFEAWWDHASDVPTWLMDADAPTPWTEVLQAWPSRKPASPTVRIAIGPEGGFTQDERKDRACARLAGFVLRTETAAELAAGCAMQALARA